MHTAHSHTIISLHITQLPNAYIGKFNHLFTDFRNFTLFSPQWNRPHCCERLCCLSDCGPLFDLDFVDVLFRFPFCNLQDFQVRFLLGFYCGVLYAFYSNRKCAAAQLLMPNGNDWVVFFYSFPLCICVCCRQFSSPTKRRLASKSVCVCVFLPFMWLFFSAHNRLVCVKISFPPIIQINTHQWDVFIRSLSMKTNKRSEPKSIPNDSFECILVRSIYASQHNWKCGVNTLRTAVFLFSKVPTPSKCWKFNILSIIEAHFVVQLMWQVSLFVPFFHHSFRRVQNEAMIFPIRSHRSVLETVFSIVDYTLKILHIICMVIFTIAGSDWSIRSVRRWMHSIVNFIYHSKSRSIGSYNTFATFIEYIITFFSPSTSFSSSFYSYHFNETICFHGVVLSECLCVFSTRWFCNWFPSDEKGQHFRINIIIPSIRTISTRRKLNTKRSILISICTVNVSNRIDIVLSKVDQIRSIFNFL